MGKPFLASLFVRLFGGEHFAENLQGEASELSRQGSAEFRALALSARCVQGLPKTLTLDKMVVSICCIPCYLPSALC